MKGKTVNINDIKPSEFNQDYFPDPTNDELESLKESIQKHGVITAITVNQDGYIIAGHQRYHVCKELGIEEIPVMVIETKDENDHRIKLIEDNMTNKTISPSTTAKNVKALYELYGIKHGDTSRDSTIECLAEKIGKSKTTVSTLRTLGDLNNGLSKMLDEGKISQGVAYQLAQLDEKGQNMIMQELRQRESMAAENVKEAVKITKEEAKEIKEKWQESQRVIDDLKQQIKDADRQDEIDKLKRQLQDEQNKQPQIVVQKEAPDDYEDLKKAKADLEKQLKKVSKNIESESEDKERYKKKSERLQRELDKVSDKLQKLDSKNAEIVASGYLMEACRQVNMLTTTLSDRQGSMPLYSDFIDHIDVLIDKLKNVKQIINIVEVIDHEQCNTYAQIEA
jgi:ParB/RepB/Spo0J family partition protein